MGSRHSPAARAVVAALDDDADVLYALEAIVRYAGWEFRGFGDGASLIRHIAKEPADLCLVDYHLPGRDGLYWVSQIRRLQPEIPILMLTVDERQSLAERCLAEGADDFVLKPLKAPDLIARLRVHLTAWALKREVARVDTGRHGPLQAEVPKGLHASTAALVREALAAEKDGLLTVKELARRTGLAVPTVYRYLRWLESLGDVEAVQRYGRVGRPLRLYRMRQADLSSA